MPTYRIRWAEGEEATVTAATAAEAERVAAARDVLAPGPVCIEDMDGPAAWWLVWCPACGDMYRLPAGVDARTGTEADPRDWTAGALAAACPACGTGTHHVVPAPVRPGTIVTR